MKIALLLALSLCGHLVRGQPAKTISIPTYGSQADTSLFFKADRALGQTMQLPSLQTSGAAFHFRLWTSRQVLDIWTLDSALYFGAVTSYAQHYDDKLFQQGRYQVDTVLFKRTYLPNSKAKRIFELLDSLSIPSIPSDNQIAGWRDGLDGIEYRIEIASPTSYAYKTYWSPHVFADTLWEALHIQLLIDKLDTRFDLATYTKPVRLLPGHYQHDGVKGVQIITLTPSQEPSHKHSIFDWF
jgi:hypothetical protein